MPATPVNVEDFMAEGGIAATTKLILEVAKQVVKTPLEKQ